MQFTFQLTSKLFQFYIYCRFFLRHDGGKNNVYWSGGRWWSMLEKVFADAYPEFVQPSVAQMPNTSKQTPIVQVPLAQFLRGQKI